MNDLNNTPGNLSAFMDTVNFYEMFESYFHSGDINKSTISKEIKNGITKIENIISLETDKSNIFSMACYQLQQMFVKLNNCLETQQCHTEIPLKKSRIVFSCGDITLAHLKHLNNVGSVQTLTHEEPTTSTNNKKEDDDIDKLYQTVKQNEVTPRVVGFKEVAGLENIKNILETVVILPIKQPQLYKGLKVNNCILLFGPPGTGKTRLVHALAAEASVSLFCIGASTILSPYIGQTEKMLHAIFKYMKKNENKKILFIDEIDGLCRQRSGSENDHTRRLKTELMCELSDFENCESTYLICATNCPWDLDTAFIRRFQERLYVPLPDAKERFQFLKVYTKGTDLEFTSDRWEPIIQLTEGYSGSDMANLIQCALRVPITQLQHTKVWELVDDKHYVPYSKYNSLAEYIVCDLKDLPPNTVKARNVELSDLNKALAKVSRTVCVNEIKKYEFYIQNR